MIPPLIAVVGLKREAALVAGRGLVVEAGGGERAGLMAKLERQAAAGPLRGVVSVGIGGALSPDLRVGDWVVAERVVSGAESWACDRGYVLRLQRALESAVRPLTLPTPLRGAGPFPLPQGERETGGASTPLPLREREGPAAKPWEGEGSRHGGRVFTGAIAGSDVMVVDAAGKAALHAATGALAVDMESHVAARFAASHSLPFAALRVISDDARHALPKAVMVSMRPDGGLNLSAVLGSLVRDPRQLPALIRTGREAGVAFRKLALLNRHDLLGGLGVGDLDLGELALDVI